MPDIVWWLNNNFIFLGIEGVVSIEDAPEDVYKLAGQIVRKWWKPHFLLEALRRLEATHARTISDSSN
jgi:hypothetical protein